MEKFWFSLSSYLFKNSSKFFCPFSRFWIIFGFGVQILDCRIEFLEETRVAALGFPSLMRTRIQLFTQMRILILQKIMRIRIRNPFLCRSVSATLE